MSARYSTSTGVATILQTTFSTSAGETGPSQSQVVDIIDRVSEYITQYTGKSWSFATTTEYMDVHGEYRRSLSKVDVWGASQLGVGTFNKQYGGAETVFFLKHRPIVTIGTLQENLAGTSSETWSTRASGYGGDFLIYREEGYVEFIRNYPFPGYRNLRILYTYGEASIPADIRYATELLTAVEVGNMIKRDSDQQGLQSVTIGQTSYNFGDLEKQLKRYEMRAYDILNQRGTEIRMVWR